MTQLTATAPQTHLWSALGAIGTATEKLATSVRLRMLAVIVPVGVLLLGFWLRAGTAPTVTFGVLVAVMGAVGYLRRHHPQAAGVLVATTLALGTLCVAVTAAISTTGMVPTFAAYLPLMLMAVTAAVFVAPHRGVHIGWSVALGQGMILAALPVHMVAPGTVWSSLSTIAGFVGAIALIYFRARKAQARSRRWWRRVVRGTVLAIIIGVGGLTVSAAATPGDAHALFGIGDMIESKTNDLICSFTRPDLTPEAIGSGAESILSTRNLGQVKAGPGGGEPPNSIPQNSDQAKNYDRLGPNYSLDNYTLFEVSGLRGLKFINWQKNSSGEEVCSIMPWVSVVTGNIVMKFNVYLLQIIIFLKEFSQADRPFHFLYDDTIPFVNSVFVHFFVPFGCTAMTIGAVYMAVRLLGNGGFRAGLSDMGGLFFVLILGGLLYGGLSGASWANPNSNGWFILASSLDETTTELNSGITELAFDVFTWDSGQMMCTKPVPVPDQENKSAGFNAAVPGQRYSSCVLAEALAYRPWAIATFGSSANNELPVTTEVTRFGDPRVGAPTNLVTAQDDNEGQGLPCYNNYSGCDDMRAYLIAQEGGPSFAAAREECMDDNGDYNHLVQCDPYHAVASELTEQSEDENSAVANKASEMLGAYHGQGSFPHLTQALVAFVGTVVTGIGVGVVSVICLWWHMMLFVLFLFGPFRLAAASLPGNSRMALEYVANFVSTFIYRLAYGILCTIMIVVVLTIFTMPINMGLKILFLILFLLLSLKAITKTQEAAKVKGSTTTGPNGSLQKAAVGGAIAGYLTAKNTPAMARGGWNAGATTAKGVRNATIGRPAPQGPPGGPSSPAGPASPGTPAGVGAGAGAGAGAGPTVRGRPIGGLAGAAVKGANKVAPPVGKAARKSGTVAAAFALPATRAAGNAGRDAAQAGRHAGRMTNRGVGSVVQRISGSETVDTASGYARSAAGWVGHGAQAAGREAKGVMSWATPRYLGESMSPETRQTLDANVSSSRLARAVSGSWRSTFEEHASNATQRREDRAERRSRRADNFARRLNKPD